MSNNVSNGISWSDGDKYEVATYKSPTRLLTFHLSKDRKRTLTRQGINRDEVIISNGSRLTREEIEKNIIDYVRRN